MEMLLRKQIRTACLACALPAYIISERAAPDHNRILGVTAEREYPASLVNY